MSVPAELTHENDLKKDVTNVLPQPTVQKVEPTPTPVDNVNKNQRMLLWAILVVVVVIILWLVFGNNKKVTKVELVTENRQNLEAANKQTALPGVATVSSVSIPSSASVSAAVSSDSASQVRKELVNLFKSYA
jgi:cytoskeletal protein RodZ